MIVKQHYLALVVLGVFSGAIQAAPIEPTKLYQENCAKCHGESGAADNWRGYLYFVPSFRNAEWQAKHSDAELLEEIDKGPRIMPSFKDSLSAEQKAALVRVIRGFGR